MKTKIFILLLLLTGSALAQENSFIEPDVSSVKGFGAVVTKYSSLNNYDAFTIGGRGGWIFDNSIILLLRLEHHNIIHVVNVNITPKISFNHVNQYVT